MNRYVISPKLLDRLYLVSDWLVAEEESNSVGRKKKRWEQFHMVKNGAILLGVPVIIRILLLVTMSVVEMKLCVVAVLLLQIPQMLLTLY